MVDARLPDGGRLNVVIEPLAVDGPMVSIRKFRQDPLTVSYTHLTLPTTPYV